MLGLFRVSPASAALCLLIGCGGPDSPPGTPPASGGSGGGAGAGAGGSPGGAGGGAGQAGAGAGGAAAPGGKFASSASRTLGGTTFVWEFNCGGRPCRYGTFVNGDFWVVPQDDQGKKLDAVAVTAIKPDGVNNGAEANPSTVEHHGLLTHHQAYEASRNVMTSLPFAAKPGTSLFKASVDGLIKGCRDDKGCIASDDVLTVLADPPEDDGATVFRPPFHGSHKPLFSTKKVRLSRLSSLPSVSADVFKKETFADAAARAVARWTVPVHIIAHTNGDSDLYRILTPLSVLTNYGAQQAGDYLGDVLAMQGAEPAADKAQAVHALMQKGIDVYGALRADIPLGSGAGQHLGQKPALAFFAALYDDDAVLAEVRATASDPDKLARGFFQEDSQVARGINGVPLWGETTDGNLEAVYWAGYFGTWAAVHLGGTDSDRNGAHGDPYRYIDGPGGGVSGNQDSSRNYQTVAVHYLVSYALNQKLMPWYRHAAADDELHEYSDRQLGYNTPGFPGGFWSKPDECAGADDRESVGCKPYDGGAGCQYFKVTWGPDPAAPGKCILYSGNAHTTHGRWPESHGASLTTPSALWAALRPCLDPGSPGYGQGACAGLGPTP